MTDKTKPPETTENAESKFDYDVTDLDALEAARPDCVATVKRPNRVELRKIVNAARILKIEIPGVTIHPITPDAPKTA